MYVLLFIHSFIHFITVQKNLSGLHNSIAQQFEKMLSQMSSQKQLLTEMEENVLKVISMYLIMKDVNTDLWFGG